MARDREETLGLVEQMEWSDKIRHKAWTDRTNQMFLTPRPLLAQFTVCWVLLWPSCELLHPSINIHKHASKGRTLFYSKYCIPVNVHCLLHIQGLSYKVSSSNLSSTTEVQCCQLVVIFYHHIVISVGF